MSNAVSPIRHWMNAVLTVALVAATAAAQDSEFLPAVRLHADGRPLELDGFFRAPCLFVADMDGDGLDDLLAAEYRAETVRIFSNEGGPGQPELAYLCELTGGDGDDVLKAPVGGGFRPSLADFDGDGKLDMVSGTRSGLVLFLRGMGDEDFGRPFIVRRPGVEILRPGGNTFCHAVDWDGDQDHDLFIGCELENKGRREGAVMYVENRGTGRKPVFSAPVRVAAKVLVGFRTQVCPVVADWDADGRLDLLVGKWTGEIQIFAGPDVPGSLDFQPGTVLVPSPFDQLPADPEGQVQRGKGGRLCVTDWNSDGRLDILIAARQKQTKRPKIKQEQTDATADLRRQAAGVLTRYRRLQREVPRATPRYKEFQRRNRQQLAAQLTELDARISALEAPIRLEENRPAYVWYLQRKGGAE